MHPESCQLVVRAKLRQATAARQVLREAGHEPAEVAMRKAPQMTVDVGELGEESVQKLADMYDALEELDDVQRIHSNAVVDGRLFDEVRE